MFYYFLIFFFITFIPLSAAPTDDLFDAALKGDLQRAADAINGGADLNAEKSLQNGVSRTVLMIAIEAGHLEFVKLLLNKGADIEKKNSRDVTSLYIALQTNREEIADYLIQKGVDTKHISKFGRTFLHASVYGGNIKYVKFFLENGIDLNAKDTYGSMPLIIALEKGHTEIGKILIENNADINTKIGEQNEPILLLAVKKGYWDFVKLLIEHNADVNVKDNKGLTTLIIASEAGNVEIVELLIKKKADVNAKADLIETALMKASERGHIDVVRLLVENKADVTVKHISRRTALMKASSNGYLEIVKFLLKNTTEEFIDAMTGESSLYLAIKYDNIEVVIYLLEQKSELFKISLSRSEEVLHFFKILEIINKKGAEEHKKYSSLLEKVLLKQESDTFLWFLYSQNSQDRKAREVFARTNPKIPEDMLYRMKFKISFMPDFYFLLSRYYSIHKNFYYSDKYLELAMEGSKSFFIYSKKNKDLEWYREEASREKKGYLYALLQEEKKPKFLLQAGHAGRVNWIAYSPDGKTIATASSDKTARIWSNEGKLIQEMKGHTEDIDQIVYAPNGKTLASTSSDKTARIWSNDGKLLHELKGHLFGEVHIAYSPDNKKIASASSGSAMVKIWGNDGKLLIEFNASVRGITNIIYSPNGDNIVTTSFEKTVKIWSNTGKLLNEIKGHTESIIHITYSPDGKTIATASADKTGKIWSIDGKLLYDLKGHTASITHIAYSPDGKTIVTASADKTGKIWSIDGKLLYDLKGQLDSINKMTYSPDGKNFAIISTSNDKIVRILKNDGKLLSKLIGHSGSVYHVAYSPDGQSLATASSDKTVRIWRNDGNLLNELIGHSGSVNHVAYSPDGQSLATASSDKTVRIWRNDGKLLNELVGHSEKVNHVTYSPDGKILITTDFIMVRIWNNTGHLLHEFPAHTGDTINNIAYSPKGGTFATASRDNTIIIWDYEGKLVIKLNAHSSSVTSLHYLKEGKILASSSSDGSIKFWDTDFFDNKDFVMTESRTLLFATQVVFHDNSSIVFTPDGHFEITSLDALDYVSYKTAKNEFIDLSSLYDKFHTPGLLKSILDGTYKPQNTSLEEGIEKRPFIQPIGFKNEETISVDSNTKEKEITFQLKENGDKIDNVLLFVNNVQFDTGLKKIKSGKELKIKVPLNFGTNKVEILAYNKIGYPRTVTLEINRKESNEKVKPILYVLAVGIDNYASKKIDKLSFSVKDSTQIAEIFQTSPLKKEYYSDIRVVHLKEKEAKKEDIVKQLSLIQQKANPDDVVFLYFSGHGNATKPKKENGDRLFYFVPQDFPDNIDYSRIENAKKYGIDSDTLQSILLKIKAHRLALIFDACYSGALTDVDFKGDSQVLDKLVNGTGRFLFSSSASDETSKEPRVLGNGLFTWTLLAGVGKREASYPEFKNADSNPVDKTITINELNSYIPQTYSNIVEKFKKRDINFKKINKNLPKLMSLPRNRRSAVYNDFPVFVIPK